MNAFYLTTLGLLLISGIITTSISWQTFIKWPSASLASSYHQLCIFLMLACLSLCTFAYQRLLAVTTFSDSFYSQLLSVFHILTSPSDGIILLGISLIGFQGLWVIRRPFTFIIAQSGRLLFLGLLSSLILAL